ncbi:MAG: peptidoglycan DD-metalloendopeptidase family protein [Traorella sp.]
MIAYEKKNHKAKRNFYLSLGFLLILCVGIITYEKIKPTEPVFNDTFTLKLPAIEEKIKETTTTKVQFVLPYREGNVVVDYFDGESGKIISVVEFEGVYRPSQGVDISNNETSFDVYSASDGVVLEVMNDTLLGNGIKIQSGEYILTYQSLDSITLKKGDAVKQNDQIGKASSNIYQASLKNHLHLVVEKNGIKVNPNTIFKFK